MEPSGPVQACNWIAFPLPSLRLLFGKEKCEVASVRRQCRQIQVQVSEQHCNYTSITTGHPPDTAVFTNSCRGTRQLLLPSRAPFMPPCSLILTGQGLFDVKLKTHHTDCTAVQWLNIQPQCSFWFILTPPSKRSDDVTVGHNTFPLRGAKLARYTTIWNLDSIYLFTEKLCEVWGLNGGFVKDSGTAVSLG